MRKVIPLVILLLIVAAGAGAWWYLRGHPEALTQLLTELEIQPVQPIEGLSASGFIEAEEVIITAEVGGRIEEIAADEGDEVKRGDVLVELDKTLLMAQMRQAEAAVEVAEAALAQVKAGARPEDVRQAEAALAQAEATRDGAYQAWLDAQAVLNNPQELESRIDAARAQVEVAKHQVDAAVGGKDAAEAYMRSAERLVGFLSEPTTVSFWTGPPPAGHRARITVKVDPGSVQAAYAQWNETSNEWWQAWIGVNTAVAEYEGAQRDLENLLAMRKNPQSLKAQVDETRAEYQMAEAAVREAQAQLDLLRAGAREEQVAVAQAQVEQARKALRTLEVQLQKMSLVSPRDGWVVERTVHMGEMAVPGAALLTVADLEEVTLTVYIPEDEIGKVKVGQGVEVRVDSYPDRVFEGEVTYIASEAEFTPKNVQTKKERVNMVFAVKVKLPNPDHALKPGMPADAVIEGS